MTVQSHDGWRVRVRDTNKRIFGAGVLVAPDLVVTCAHVVAKALRLSDPAHPPAAPVVVDFPTDSAAGMHLAHVVAGGWITSAEDFTGDLALLRIERPVAVRPAPIGPCGLPSRRRVRVFGHAGGSELGRWSNAQLSGTAGPTGEWVQINDDGGHGPPIVGGFSGAGVVDDATGIVIGMLVGADRQQSAQSAWMVTTEAMAHRMPDLAAFVGTYSLAGASTDVPPPDHNRAGFEAALVQALLALDGIQDRSHRDDLVSAVERSLRQPLGASRSDRVRTDLLNIVVALLDRPTPAALHLILDAARVLHGETPAIRDLARLVARDSGRRLTGNEVQRLDALVSEMPADDIAEATRRAFGAMGPKVDIDASNLAEIVRALSDLMGRPGDSPPLLVFLQLLADRMHGLAAAALRDWVQHIAERWQISPEELRLPEPDLALPAPTSSYLIVELREDGPNPDRFLMSIWLEHDNGDGRALHVDDDQPLTIDEVPGHVGQHLRRAAGSRLGAVGTLTIEFVLPYRLLDHPVDQMRIVLGGELVPIGAAFPVMVRSLDRISSPMFHHRWQSRWRWLSERRNVLDPRAISFVRLDGVSRQALIDALNRDPDGHSDTHPVCLVLTVPTRTRNAPSGPQNGALRHAVEIGMPVLVWCRLAKATAQFLVDMANQLNNRPIDDVPAVIQRMRREATLPGRPSDHLGQHICLLWDDHDRLPPSQALRAPA